LDHALKIAQQSQKQQKSQALLFNALKSGTKKPET
jgi:hypothetical protein